MNMTKSEVDISIIDLLKDGGWHCFGEILNKVGTVITAEKATQHFMQKVCKKQKDRPLEEQVSMGRRWKVSGACAKLVRKGKIMARGKGFQQEYCLKNAVQATQPQPQQLLTGPTQQSGCSCDVFDSFHTACMNSKLESGEIDDLLFHFRAIKRILGRR